MNDLVSQQRECKLAHHRYIDRITYMREWSPWWLCLGPLLFIVYLNDSETLSYYKSKYLTNIKKCLTDLDWKAVQMSIEIRKKYGSIFH